MHLRPAVGRPFQEAHRLHRFENAVVVEVGQARIPAPAAPRQAQLLTGVVIGGNALLHPLHLPGAQPEEMTLEKGVGAREIADVHVEPAVPVDVAEIDPHPLERILAQHTGARRRETSLALQQRKAQLAGFRPVVQQPIRPEVVGDVDLGQPIPVEIGGPQRQRPTVAGFTDAPRISFFRKDEVRIDLLELDERGFPAARLLPQEEVRSPAVEGPGQRFRHGQSATPVGIEIGRLRPGRSCR